MEVFGYIASILIGISLGMLGSGGSILTVPVLVYLMHINPLLATTSSLFIVGTTSLVGGLRAYSKKLVDFKAVTEFGIPSIFSIFLTRHYLLPALPDQFFTIGKEIITKEIFLMV
ncbi:MAG: sulfite exporter TauE/SafE family protein, partial [Chitinophagaceae bacterium]